MAESLFHGVSSYQVSGVNLHQSSSFSCCSSLFSSTIFPLQKNAVIYLKVLSIQQKMARQSHEKHASDFHDNYGNAVLTSGATFYITVWTYETTQIGKEWILSPVGRVTPKEWKH
ncbi:cytochrome c oxidase subunit 7B, mitochondrial-like [Urocitellus parryii]